MSCTFGLHTFYVTRFVYKFCLFVTIAEAFSVATKRLYNRVCVSVRRFVSQSVRPSVAPAFVLRPAISDLCLVYGLVYS